MRAFLAALALAGNATPSTLPHVGPPLQVAQMARDVTDAVRKQRAERCAPHRQNHQGDRETKR
jgi:hypothetical protein